MMILTAERPRVLVKHSEPIFAMGITAMLGRMPGFDVIADDAEPCNTGGTRIIVCDYDSGRAIADEASSAGIVVVARRPRGFEIQDAIARGVLGYVVASCSLGELESAVRAASQGRRFLCQAAAQEVADGLTVEALTTRERDVLVLLAQGRCNKTIANHLDIAVGTVKAHVRAIMAKLNAGSRTEAASIASSRGLLPDSSVDEVASMRRRPAPAHSRAAVPERATVFD